ncbi:MAG: prolyl oligopeptidase family serine peptidase [Candidatus Krumholzibacteriia bacterium]
MRRCCLLCLLVPMLALARTGEVREVREVLVREVARAEPAALTSDPVARAVAAGRFSAPVAGEPDPDGVVWQPVLADSTGWIVDDRLIGAYAHATVTVPTDGVYVLDAMGYAGVLVNGEPRVGNIYGYTDQWEPWQPAFDWSRVPVRLHAGANTFLFRGNRYGLMRARLAPAASSLLLNTDDLTRPDLVAGAAADTWAALPVLNCTADVVVDAVATVALMGADPVTVALPVLPPHGVRKVALPVRGLVGARPGRRQLQITVAREGRTLDQATVDLDVKLPGENRRVTFRSRLDGSVQYYGLLPASGPDGPHALLLSLHGAAVEAINQSGSYPRLPWAHVVAPTNRRPFGFNWEDWGRRDALEVLDLALADLDVDPTRVYLTGHSMGGHGSWHLATLAPDRFAAVGPSAGWVSFWSYRPDRAAAATSPLITMLERAALPSRTLTFAPNLQGLGVYVLHGLDDDVVSVDEARAMRARLADFHRDTDWHEQPGAGHWWDLSDSPGADCVAWAPMLDFFARHRRPDPAECRHVSFATPNPALSARRAWATVGAQQTPFTPSTLDLDLDPQGGTLAGTTANVARLGLDLAHVTTAGLLVALDGDTLQIDRIDPGRALWLVRDPGWRVAGDPDPGRRGLVRGGGFREAFGNRVQLVYGTGGTPAETAWALARARYDAEYLWYQGNASLDVLPDTLFDPAAEPDRNVILYGNADTVGPWTALWPDDDLVAARGTVRVGDRVLSGDGLGLLAVRPRPGGAAATVGVVAGSGLAGLRLLDGRPVLSPGVAYPDVTVFEDLQDSTVVRGAGFLGPGWRVAGGEFVWAEGPWADPRKDP